MASKKLLAAFCVVALLAVRSESHGLGDFPTGAGETNPQMQDFFKPEAASIPLPESLDGSSSSTPSATMAAKPEATAIPTTTTTATAADTNPAATAGAGTSTFPRSSAAPRRSVSVAAGVACGVAAVAVVGIAAAVAYVVRGRRAGARRGTAVQLGSSP